PYTTELIVNNMQQIKVGIVGGAGYTGGELIRILINHPRGNLSFIHSKSNAGNFFFQVHGDLIGEKDLQISRELRDDICVLCLCVGHGEARKFLEETKIPEQVKIIDLSQDYRLHQHHQRPTYNNRPFVYGLPELNKAEIRKADYIANPGCFATAIQLGLLP